MAPSRYAVLLALPLVAGCQPSPRQPAIPPPPAPVAAPVAEPGPQGDLAALEVMARSDPAAAFDLGMRLFRGEGVSRDGGRGMEWVRAAAEDGDARAATALGRLYLTGFDGIAADLAQARSWLSVAAGLGQGEAAALLAETRTLTPGGAGWRARAPVWAERTGWWWRRSPYAYYWGPDRGWKPHSY
jgi:TPR repeat protein